MRERGFDQSKRDFLKAVAAGAGASLLAACGFSASTETPGGTEVSTDPVPTPVKIEPTPIPSATPTVEGAVVPGTTLEMGGASLELVKRDGRKLAVLVEAEDRSWLIVTDDKGQVGCFLGEEEGEHIAVLAQGPPGYQWNTEAHVWQSKDGLEIVVPDVILPGSWNEEANLAGPTAWAKFAFMVQEAGQYKNVVLYSSETINEMVESGADLETQKIEVLGDGKGMWVGNVVKRANLEAGQTITRNPNTGTLTVIDQEGQPVRTMIVRWSEIKSAEEVRFIGNITSS